MFGKIVLSLLTLGATFTVVCAGGTKRVDASDSANDPLQDTDNDLLPDCIEWAVLTNAANADTDGDQIPDFVEVVQRGSPRAVGEPLPADQEMRIVVTGSAPGSPGSETWMHLLVRMIEPGTLTSFRTWIEFPQLPGVQLEFDLLSLGPAVFRERFEGAGGTWLCVSVPLASAALLQTILPCSFHVESVLGGRQLRSSVSLFDLQGCIATLVPYDHELVAVQAIAPYFTNGGLGSLSSSNRICVIDLVEVGWGSGGTVYEVSDAFCDDCNDTECVANCSMSVGWILTLPGGLTAINGQDN